MAGRNLQMLQVSRPVDDPRMCSPALKKCVRVRGTERGPSAPPESAQRNAKLQHTNTLGLRVKGMSEAWTVKEGFMEEVAMSLEIW